MYRAVTLYFQKIGFDLASSQEEIERALSKLDLNLKNDDGEMIVLLDGEDVSRDIREAHVSKQVSEVSAISAVRKALVQIQRKVGSNGGIVMDGRDIGTVVFPDADLKIFMTASLERRVQRRLDQDRANGIESNEEEVKKNLEHRDRLDTTRADSPLKQADDAILLDNSDLSEDEQVAMVIRYANQIIDSNFKDPDES